MPIVRIVFTILTAMVLGENKLKIAPLRDVLCISFDQAQRKPAIMTSIHYQNHLDHGQNLVFKVKTVAVTVPKTRLNYVATYMRHFDSLVAGKGLLDDKKLSVMYEKCRR
ncbi:hypothetical protein A9Q79_10305 [Methylophaga sp. 42_25_T18]|nr:hypothetical protein A9Q79_10305 [Methylophaga sp. 42_25_T18]